MNNRELPPTPAERRDCLPPTERLDRLTGAAGGQQGGGPSGSRPLDPNRRRSAIGDQGREARQVIARSRSVGPQGYPPADVGGGKGGGAFWPGEGEREPRDGRDQSYGRESDRFVGAPSSSSSSARQLPPSRGAPRPGQQRPASVMGQPSPSPQLSPRSRRDGGVGGNPHWSPPTRQGLPGPEPAAVNSANSPVRRREAHQGFVERPKSVPPHLFNKADGSSFGGQGGGSNANSNCSGDPVPPPRYSRDVTSRASLDGQPRDGDCSSRASMDGSVSSGRSAPSSAGPVTPHHSHSTSSSLPNRYSGPGGPPQQTGYNSPGGGSNPGGAAAMNHNAATGRLPAQQQQQQQHPGGFPGPGGAQGGARQDSPGGGQPYGRSVTPGPRYGSEPYGREAPDAGSPYSTTPQRPQSSAGRAYYHGNPPNPLSAQQRLNPGPQAPLRAPPPPDHNHHPLLDQHPHANHHHHHSPAASTTTPMARIPPQTKAASTTPAGRGDPSAGQRTAVGDEQPPDRPKQNSMWYEYGCV